MTVGVVVVSHSARLADGVVEVAGQMAPGVTLAAAGGTDDGDVGTSLEHTLAALAAADTGDGCVLLYDLGSARMTAELALETLGDEERGRTRLVDAALVEGALAAAVTAAGGAAVDAVAAAAADAAGAGRTAEPPAAPGAQAPAGEAVAERQATLVNRLGLHARPAALVVRAAREFDADVRLVPHDDPSGAGASARSLLAIVGLGATGGTTLRLRATGPDAAAALDRLTGLIADGFGENGD